MALDIFVNVGSGNALLLLRQQAFTYTNTELLLIVPLETNGVKSYSWYTHFSLSIIHLRVWSTNASHVLRNILNSYDYRLSIKIEKQLCMIDYSKSYQNRNLQMPPCW